MESIIFWSKKNRKTIERWFVFIGAIVGGIKGYNLSSSNVGIINLYGNKLAGTFIGGGFGGFAGLIISAALEYELGLLSIGGTIVSYVALQYLDSLKVNQ
jgi:hypothetical protein